MQLAFDDVLRKALSDPSRIAQRMTELGTRGRKGMKRLAYLVEDATPDQGKQEKGLERMFFRILKEWGKLPLPLPQFRIFDHIGFICRADASWPEKRVAVELDSRREHGGDTPFELDRAKTNRLQLAGWISLRYTYKRLTRHTHEVLTELETAYNGRPIFPF